MVIKQEAMIKTILIAIVFVFLCFSFIIFTYSDDISNKLTYNLNRNLDVDWGSDHPKFIKHNLNVDLLGMSISWDYFNIDTPTSQVAHILNAISNIKSYGCISNIRLSLKIIIDINCNEIRVNLKQNRWIKYKGLNISSTFFFVERVFHDFYDKQGFYEVNIDTDNLYINDTNQGKYIIKYTFQDEDNLIININKNEITLKKQEEGLNIRTPNSNFFILNHNFFEYRRRLDRVGA